MYQQSREPVLSPAASAPRNLGASKAMMMLIVLTSLVIITGAGFISFAAVIHPMQLHAQATAVVHNIQTLASPQSVYDQVTSRVPTFEDALDSQRAYWQNDTTCTFTGGAYHVQVSAAAFESLCLKEDRDYHNFIYQVQMTSIHGSASGIIFRASSTYDQYIFAITDTGLYLFSVSSGELNSKGLAFGRSAAIKTGPNQPNLLAVMAQGSTINLYINKQFLISINDDTYASGEVGCFVGSIGQTNVDVAFSNAQIWSLS